MKTLLSFVMASFMVFLFAVTVRATDSGPGRVAESDELYKPATLSDGTLVAIALRTVEGVQTGVGRYSADNGRSWSGSKPLFKLPKEAGTFGYYVLLVDREGEVHIFFLNDPSTGASGSRAGVGTPGKKERLNIWHIKSMNNARNWQPAKQIWEGRGGDLQSAIQLQNGRILLPISSRTSRSWRNRGEGLAAYTYMGQFNCSALYSDDGGATWHQSPSVLMVPAPDLSTILGAVEPVLIQLKDGRVWMLIRTQMGRFYESSSGDNGTTWSAPQPSPIIASDSPAGLVRLKDGRILLLVNRCLRFPYAYGGRHVLHAAVSEDEGRTWSGYREVVRDALRNEPPPTGGDFGAAYPFPSLTKDGKIIFALGVLTGTLSQHPEQVPGFIPRQARSLFIFDPAWLLETRQKTDFSSGLDDWSAFGTRGVELVPHPAKPGAQALSIRRPHTDWPASAVWNFPMGAKGRLRMRLMLKPGFAGALVGLSDHFSVPFDDEDKFYNLYNFAIGPAGQLKGGEKLERERWYNLEIGWDTVKRNARVLIDGRETTVLPLLRETEGACYLRLRSTAPQTDTAGFLVESVEADVSESRVGK